MSELVLDAEGFPVLLADVAGSGVSSVDANAKSGNPRHDTRSGKFGSGGGGGKRGPSQAQANIDPIELKIMRDAIADAARHSTGMSEEDATSFLRTRARNFDTVDIGQFLNNVREKRLDDLADILAVQTRGSIAGGNPIVKTEAGKGYVRKVFAGLSDDEVVALAVRMTRRGFSDDQIKKKVIGRITDPERLDALHTRFGEESKPYR